MEVILGQGGNGGSAAPVKNVKTAEFQRDVIQASTDHPVIVDLWAPWCGPCKQLGPALEKIVNATNGKVERVKVNIDEEPQIAQALRVQSIPAVFAFVNGQPVDGFVGVQPESQLKSFVERLVGEIAPGPVEQALEQAQRACDNGAFDQAAAIYRQVMAHQSDNVDAISGLCRALIELDRIDEATEILQALEDDIRKDDRIGSVLARIELAQGASGDTAALEERVNRDTTDLEARLELARAYAADNRREAAVDQLISIIRTQRDWNDEAARKELLKFFEAWGSTDDTVMDGRRKLSAAWFS